MLTSKKICVMGASRRQVRDLIHIQRSCGLRCPFLSTIAHINVTLTC